MNLRINCTKCVDICYCSDKRVKRSLWGIGPRMCVLYDYGIINKRCEFQVEHTKPCHPPPQPHLNGYIKGDTNV